MLPDWKNCIVLPSVECKHNLLSKYKTRSNIYTNNDLTKMQQDKVYRVCKEFKERINSGEEGIELIYYNGILSIISLKKKNSKFQQFSYVSNCVTLSNGLSKYQRFKFNS